ncbi:hypothetical protein BDZ45DRAFT_726623 [Acephala macrosclerotiorum]|nr:hypothetical protein BDZ45DRAFT_726623 [Acephala macrosclerotiorum]
MFAPQRPRPGDIVVQPASNIRSPAPALSTMSSNSTRSLSSPSQNRDLELGQASSVSNYRSKHPTKFATQKETRQKTLARQTFWATLAFGVLTLLYEAVSLLPAFHSSWSAAQGVSLQVKSEADSRQALAYSFLQECENRNTQNLPLGEDCIRNLAKTPKAPPDIDDWLMVAPASRSRALMLTVRDYVLPGNGQNGLVTSDSSTTISDGTWLANYSGPALMGIAYLVMAVWYYRMSILDYVSRLVQLLQRAWSTTTSILSVLLGKKIYKWRVKPVGKVRMTALGIVAATSLLLELAHLLQAWRRHQRWAQSMEFLASCQLQSDLGVPLGSDCIQYTHLSWTLKPPPSLDLDDKIGLALVVTYIVILMICIRLQIRDRSQEWFEINSETPEVEFISLKNMGLCDGAERMRLDSIIAWSVGSGEVVFEDF